MQKKVEKLEFVRGVTFDFMKLLKNNRTNSLLIFDVLCGESCNSRTSVDRTTARGHRELRSFYIKRNFFHQSEKKEVRLSSKIPALFNISLLVM